MLCVTQSHVIGSSLSSTISPIKHSKVDKTELKKDIKATFEVRALDVEASFSVHVDTCGVGTESHLK